MSKVFEEEYKQLAVNDIPDLWDRIEAGLTVKSESVSAAPTEEGKKPVFIIKYRKYAGVIAACLCMAIVIPAALMLGRMSKNMSASDTAEAPRMEYEAATEAAPEAIEESLEVSEESIAAEDTAALEDAAADMEGAFAGSKEESMMESAAEEAADEITNTVKESQKALRSPNIKAEMENTYKGVLKDGTVIEAVSIQVLAVEETEGITVYEALVQEESNGVLQEGSHIGFTLGVNVKGSMEAGQTYQVRLEYGEKKPYFFELIEIKK